MLVAHRNSPDHARWVADFGDRYRRSVAAEVAVEKLQEKRAAAVKEAERQRLMKARAFQAGLRMEKEQERLRLQKLKVAWMLANSQERRAKLMERFQNCHRENERKKNGRGNPSNTSTRFNSGSNAKASTARSPNPEKTICHYKVLGLDFGCNDLRKTKKSYHRLALKYHPGKIFTSCLLFPVFYCFTIESS